MSKIKKEKLIYLKALHDNREFYYTYVVKGAFGSYLWKLDLEMVAYYNRRIDELLMEIINLAE